MRPIKTIEDYRNAFYDENQDNTAYNNKKDQKIHKVLPIKQQAKIEKPIITKTYENMENLFALATLRQNKKIFEQQERYKVNASVAAP